VIYDQPIKIRIEYSIILRDISDLAMANRLLINFDYVNKQLKGDKQ